MFNKLKNLEQNFSVSKAAVIVGFFTLLSKLVGLVRDPLLAGKIGVGNTLDIYYAAFRIPDFLYNILILGALSAGFIPVLSEIMQSDDTKRRLWALVNNSINVIATVLLFLSVIQMLT